MENLINSRHEKSAAKQATASYNNKPFEKAPLFIKAGLSNSAKYENVRKQNFHQRFAVCDLLKAKGNSFFNESNIEEAVRTYEQALSIFRFIFCKKMFALPPEPKNEELEYYDYQGETKEERSMLKVIKIALYNNLAACYLKLNDFENTLAACNEALALDQNQPKALYRRAKAVSSKPNPTERCFNAALEDLKKASTLAPADASIKQAMQNIKVFLDRQKSRNGFKGIFCDKKEVLVDGSRG